MSAYACFCTWFFLKEEQENYPRRVSVRKTIHWFLNYLPPLEPKVNYNGDPSGTVIWSLMPPGLGDNIIF